MHLERCIIESARVEKLLKTHCNSSISAGRVSIDETHAICTAITRISKSVRVLI